MLRAAAAGPGGGADAARGGRRPTLRAAQAQLDLHTIASPIDGVLDSLTCSLGQTLGRGHGGGAGGRCQAAPRGGLARGAGRPAGRRPARRPRSDPVGSGRTCRARAGRGRVGGVGRTAKWCFIGAVVRSAASGQPAGPHPGGQRRGQAQPRAGVSASVIVSRRTSGGAGGGGPGLGRGARCWRRPRQGRRCSCTRPSGSADRQWIEIDRDRPASRRAGDRRRRLRFARRHAGEGGGLAMSERGAGHRSPQPASRGRCAPDEHGSWQVSDRTMSLSCDHSPSWPRHPRCPAAKPGRPGPAATSA